MQMRINIENNDKKKKKNYRTQKHVTNNENLVIGQMSQSKNKLNTKNRLHFLYTIFFFFFSFMKCDLDMFSLDSPSRLAYLLEKPLVYSAYSSVLG